MPTAASHVDMMTDSMRMPFTLIPAARANAGFEPTAVMAVPVLVCRNAQMPKARRAKNRIVPVGIEIAPILILRISASALM